MLKYIFLLLLFSSLVNAGELLQPNSSQYYTVLEKDTFYFILSNDKLLELSSSGNSNFYFVDEIEGNFSSSTIFAVNKHQLVIINNDTLFVYSRDSSGILDFMYSQSDLWNISKIDPWDYDFMITSNSIFKLLTCNSDSAGLANDSVLYNDGKIVSCPYFVKGRDIYKYHEGFGSYLIFTIPPEFDPGIRYLIVHNNVVIYFTWYQPYPSGPPTECKLKGRKLMEPNFPYQFSYTDWGIWEYWTYSTWLIKGSTKYLIYGSYSGDFYKIYNYNPTLLLDVNSNGYYPSDKYLFKFGSDGISFTQQSSPPITFTPLQYQTILAVEDQKEAMDFILLQNYPNPFNPGTTIQFSIPEDVQNVKLIIYSALGEKVAELVNTELQAGVYKYAWDAGNFASGIYIYQLVTEKFISTKKMLLFK